MRALGQGSPSRKAGAEGISLFLCIGSYLDYTVTQLYPGTGNFFFKKKGRSAIYYDSRLFWFSQKKKKSKIEKPPILRTFLNFVQIAVVSPLTLRYGVKKN